MMCIYIFAVLPKEVDTEALRPLAQKYEMSLRLARQEEFQDITGKIFYTTQGFCDCGTELGRGQDTPNGDWFAHTLDAEQEKLRRKGWSDAKITRWRADKYKAAEERIAARERELQRWMGFVPAVINSRIVPWFSVFYHDYSSEQTVHIVRQERLSSELITADFLRQMVENVLYRFTA